jgi:MFS family permease
MDRIGTRRVMLFFAVVTAGLAALYPAMPWFPVMVGLQMLIGFAGNMAWIGAQTIIARVARGDPGEIGRFSFFARIGNVVAPLVMGLLWDFAGPTVCFLSVGLWSAFLFFSVWQIPGAAVGDEGKRDFSWRDLLPRLKDYTGSLGLVLIPAVAFTLAISFLRHATNGVENSFFIVYLRDLGFAGTMIGTLFSIAEILNGFGSLASGWVARRIAIPWLMVGFTGVSIALLGATPFMGGIFVFIAAAHALRRTFEGIVQPLMFSLQARAVSRDLQGSIVGLRVTNNRLSSIITPILMGFIVEHFGIRSGFLIMSGLLLLICLGLAVLLARARTIRLYGE